MAVIWANASSTDVLEHMNVEFGQYLPNWLSIGVNATGMIAASFAAVFAWKTLKEDRVRDARRDALGVSASWVTAQLQGDENVSWGVLVHNASNAAFHDVRITTIGNNNPNGSRPIAYKQLQPGRYFTESKGRSEYFAWGHPLLIAENDLVNPAPSKTKRVCSIEFTDSLGTHWEFSPESGLRSGPRRPSSPIVPE